MAKMEDIFMDTEKHDMMELNKKIDQKLEEILNILKKKKSLWVE